MVKSNKKTHNSRELNTKNETHQINNLYHHHHHYHHHRHLLFLLLVLTTTVLTWFLNWALKAY